MSTIAFVFPHQLFDAHPALEQPLDEVVLVEDSLFFGDRQYPMRFHKQKLAFHRASMALYAKRLKLSGMSVRIEAYSPLEDNRSGSLCSRLGRSGVTHIRVAELNDFMLERRLRNDCRDAGIELTALASPGFMNTMEENQAWRTGRARWFMADFYQWQRTRFDLLMDKGKPVGGQWSFDKDNRRKLTKKHIGHLPELPLVNRREEIQSAVDSVAREFPDNPGSLERWYYPIGQDEADIWLERFLEERFADFGAYEDAMLAGNSWLYHSVLTPMLNTGLLTPAAVVNKAIAWSRDNDVPVNSVEGFVRQIVGWREFMRATYHDLGVDMRTSNHWGHTRPMPEAFYTGTTGIDPVDDVIGRVLDSGYCHHIERLMILGGFMFLCEIDPKDIYRWFMEMFIDSYDWVMVPNVYAMSQHADGGSITTKPYFSGSNYVLKMSNYRKGEWSTIWDGLFWTWVIRHSDELAGNPRWAMMVGNAQRMSAQKKREHQEVADAYLTSLS